MTSIEDRALFVSRAAAAAYAGCFLAGTYLSLLRGHKAEPLGIRTPWPISVDVAVGAGTALAAPWPLIVVMWQARVRTTEPGPPGRRARVRLAVLGGLFLAGAVAEPMARRLPRRQLPRPEALVAFLDIMLPAMMSVGAARSLLA